MKDLTIVLIAIGLIVFFGLGCWCGWKIATGISCPAIEKLDKDLADLQREYADLEKKHEANMVVVKATDMLASYYTEKSSGGKMANGKPFDENALTAASRVIKFGTILILENLSNGKISPCQITDRGPYVKGRDLDVSKAVAERLGMVKDGVANLRVWEAFRARLGRRD